MSNCGVSLIVSTTVPGTQKIFVQVLAVKHSQLFACSVFLSMLRNVLGNVDSYVVLVYSLWVYRSTIRLEPRVKRWKSKISLITNKENYHQEIQVTKKCLAQGRRILTLLLVKPAPLKLNVVICQGSKYLTFYSSKGKVMDETHSWINGMGCISENGYYK